MKKLLMFAALAVVTSSVQAQTVQQKTTATTMKSTPAGTTRTTVKTHDMATPSGNYHTSDKTHTITTPAPATTRKTAVAKRSTAHRTHTTTTQR